jgi:hypothetical protein
MRGPDLSALALRFECRTATLLASVAQEVGVTSPTFGRAVMSRFGAAAGPALSSVQVRHYDGVVASRPITRDKKETALAGGETTTAETPLKPKRERSEAQKKLNTRERMLELVKIRQEKMARGEIPRPEGRARTRFTKAEREQHALDKLMPKALKVLEEQLDDKDPRVRQAAAIKVIEYRKGKPTQMIKQDIAQVTAIRFETAAVGGAMLAPPRDLPMLEQVVEAEVVEAEVVEAEVTEDGDGETA